MAHERRIFLLALSAGLPGSLVALVLLITGDTSAKTGWTLGLLIVGIWWGCALAVRTRTIAPLQTLANLLEALREGDYSIRGRQPSTPDALGEVMVEVNALGEILRDQRFAAVDAAKLLQTVIAEIDLAVFTFDEQRRLRLVNRAGERLLAQPAPRLLGQDAAELGLAPALDGPAIHTFERAFPGQFGRWLCRHSSFRAAGLPHHLLVLSDLSQALRDEERLAWQRLIRVLGHELNNSLAPIKSTAGTLLGLLRREQLYDGWRADAERALLLIGERAEALNRFVAGYSRLARLPAPHLTPTPLRPLVARVAAFENRLAVQVLPSPEITVHADPDQLEQLLINLVKNAVEASLETRGQVAVSWQVHALALELEVQDEGPGLANTANLFVPFFTTKPGGTGIGLVLSRQIAEAHGGTLVLANRSDRTGCVARLRLPRASPLD